MENETMNSAVRKGLAVLKDRRRGAFCIPFLISALLILYATACKKDDGNNEPIVIEASSVQLDATALDLYVGETVQLTATVMPVNTSDKTVAWSSSNPGIATVTGSGSIAAVSAGKATITARCGKVKAECVVTVNKEIEVTSVTLDKTSLMLQVGETVQLTATVLPENATDKNVAWSSSDPDVAAVTAGRITAESAGTATITARCGNVQAECTVTVSAREIAVTSVTLSMSAVTLLVGESVDLTATIEPADASNRKVHWSSTDESVATVVEKDGKGHVVAINPGEAVVIAITADGGYHAFCTVQVDSKVDRITLSRNALSLYTTDAQNADASNRTLTATVTPADAEVELVWISSDKTVATVKATGNTCVVTPVGSGTATVRVSTPDGSVSASASVTVKQPYTTITLDRQTLSLDEGATATLTATASPQTADDAVVWASSDPAVVTVDANGGVSAVNSGTAVITAASRERPTVVRATCTVTVTSPVVHVTGVSVSPEKMTMEVGETKTIVATIWPTNADNKNMSWRSSDESVATVNASGTIVARSIGTTTITVTTEDGGHTATCNVTVLERPVGVTSLVLDKSAITLTFGNSAMLIAILLPANATNKNVIWTSSDETLAKVEGGRVTAQQKAGTVMITATSEDNPSISATCTVKIVSQLIPVTGLTVTPNVLDIYMGEQKQLTATVSPSNATDPSVVWSVQQGDVVSVDQNGVVTPLKVGSTRIIVTTNDGGYQRFVQVTVKKKDENVEVTSISLNKTSATLQVGETLQLTATVSPADATDKVVKWSSSNPSIVTVTNGKVTAMGVGTATITAKTSNGLSATCRIVVEYVPSGSLEGTGEEKW